MLLYYIPLQGSLLLPWSILGHRSVTTLEARHGENRTSSNPRPSRSQRGQGSCQPKPGIRSPPMSTTMMPKSIQSLKRAYRLITII